jgi:hypothetical protein
LEITIQQEKKEETRRIDMNLPMYVVKNKEFVCSFHTWNIDFRPDLKIDPLALRNFSIDPVPGNQ